MEKKCVKSPSEESCQCFGLNGIYMLEWWRQMTLLRRHESSSMIAWNIYQLRRVAVSVSWWERYLQGFHFIAFGSLVKSANFLCEWPYCHLSLCRSYSSFLSVSTKISSLGWFVCSLKDGLGLTRLRIYSPFCVELFDHYKAKPSWIPTCWTRGLMNIGLS